MRYNMQACREIENASRQFVQTTGKGYEEIFKRKIESIISKYGCIKRIVKQFDNGIKSIQIMDKNGAIVSEYHGIE